MIAPVLFDGQKYDIVLLKFMQPCVGPTKNPARQLTAERGFELSNMALRELQTPAVLYNNLRMYESKMNVQSAHFDVFPKDAVLWAFMDKPK